MWRYRLELSSGGMLLTESFEFVWCPVGNRAVELFIPRGSQINHGIHETLQRIAKAASTSVVPQSYVRRAVGSAFVHPDRYDAA